MIPANCFCAVRLREVLYQGARPFSVRVLFSSRNHFSFESHFITPTIFVARGISVPRGLLSWFCTRESPFLHRMARLHRAVQWEASFCTVAIFVLCARRGGRAEL